MIAASDQRCNRLYALIEEGLRKREADPAALKQRGET